MVDTLIKLKLSVWKDFVPSRALLFRSEDGDATSILCSENQLQQEIYSWQMKENPLDGVVDDITRSSLAKLLYEAYEPAKHPSERGLEGLKTFVVEAQKVIGTAKVEWTGSQEIISDEDVPHRLNPLLALTLHINWLVSCFADQPGISVAIR